MVSRLAFLPPTVSFHFRTLLPPACLPIYHFYFLEEEEEGTWRKGGCVSRLVLCGLGLTATSSYLLEGSLFPPSPCLLHVCHCVSLPIYYSTCLPPTCLPGGGEFYHSGTFLLPACGRKGRQFPCACLPFPPTDPTLPTPPPPCPTTHSTTMSHPATPLPQEVPMPPHLTRRSHRHTHLPLHTCLPLYMPVEDVWLALLPTYCRFYCAPFCCPVLVEGREAWDHARTFTFPPAFLVLFILLPHSIPMLPREQ